MRVEQKDLLEQHRHYIPRLSRGLFIHPTDTHYSIGCDATNTNLVLRLRLLKRRHSHPFVVLAPSKHWILENLDVPEDALDHLPGPVTIIGRLKNISAVCRDVHLGSNVLGVRIPNHWISDIVKRIGKPIVSTCANKHAETLMTNLDNADPDILRAAELVIHEGHKHGQPGVWIDYTDGVLLQ